MPQLSRGQRCVEWTQTECVSICVGGCENTKPGAAERYRIHRRVLPWLLYSLLELKLTDIFCALRGRARVCFREKSANKYK